MDNDYKLASAQDIHEINSNTEPQISPSVIIPPKAVQKINSNIFTRIDFSENLIGFQGGPQKKSGIKLALWTWLSAAIDMLVLVSSSCFFIVVFSFLMHTQAKKIILSLMVQPNVVNLFCSAFAVSFWGYLIFMRVFNGATIGEWTCQLRLGQPMQRLRVNYFFKVLLRTTVVLVTGVVTLPLLSLLFKKDLAGEISGVKIYSLK